MRTSAQKNLPLFARIAKEISRVSDLALRARNFAPIVRSRASALGAIARDLKFLDRDVNCAHLSNSHSIFSARSKNIF
jgi:hypothetical protein